MILNHYLTSSELINYYDVLFVLQQHFRTCFWCQCINLVSSSPSFLSGLRYPSHRLNSTTVSDADPGQSPDAQEETCFSLGPSGKPSCPSAITPCFLNTAQCFDPHLLMGSPSPMWPEDMQPPSFVPGILFPITVQTQSSGLCWGMDVPGTKCCYWPLPFSFTKTPLAHRCGRAAQPS